MSSLNKLILYTQPRCSYCHVLQKILDSTIYKYSVIDITENDTAKKFIQAEGHTTVPQLYYGIHKINNIPTIEITPQYIEKSIKLVEEVNEEWAWVDSGVEDFS